jgi:hypothetical protein
MCAKILINLSDGKPNPNSLDLVKCIKCTGAGKFGASKCPVCNGAGEMTRSKQKRMNKKGF